MRTRRMRRRRHSRPLLLVAVIILVVCAGHLLLSSYLRSTAPRTQGAAVFTDRHPVNQVDLVAPEEVVLSPAPTAAPSVQQRLVRGALAKAGGAAWLRHVFTRTPATLVPAPPPLLNEAPTYAPTFATVPPRRRRPALSTPAPPTARPTHATTEEDDNDVKKLGRSGAVAAVAAVHVKASSSPRSIAMPDAAQAELAFHEALHLFVDQLAAPLAKGNPEQPTKDYIDIDEDAGHGVALPYDAAFVEHRERWEACDARNVSFSAARDRLCQEYLQNVNNMRFIKAMETRLTQGRTIKVKIRYAHNNIQAIVKVSQRKFYFEAASEYLAFRVDRALDFGRVPITVFTPLPVDYLRVATSYSPLYAQWFQRFVVLYNKTRENLVPCVYPTSDKGDAPARAAASGGLHGTYCSMVTIQLWMSDIHPTLDTFLALPYEFDTSFTEKYFVPGHPLFSGMRRARLRAIGELLDRFVFDFLIGNSDRGMNEHNNFAYGGCSAKTACVVASPDDRIYGQAKYAYLDQGSSLYSHKEVVDNPFFGDVTRIRVCRFRRGTYDALRSLKATNQDRHPIVRRVEAELPPAIYNVTRPSLVRVIQNRLEKVLAVVDKCLATYPDEVVFSLPAFDQVHIAEEDATLADDDAD